MTKNKKNIGKNNKSKNQSIDSLMLLPGKDWDLTVAQKLAKVIDFLDGLDTAIYIPSIKPSASDLTPWLLRKALDVHRFDGNDLNLLQAYEISRKHHKDQISKPIDFLLKNYYEYLDHIEYRMSFIEKEEFNPFRIFEDLVKGAFPKTPGFRQEKVSIMGPKYPLPKVEDVRDIFGSISTYITENKILHPIIRIGLIFPQIMWLEPFAAANSHFSFLLVDGLVFKWMLRTYPAFNFAAALLGKKELLYKKLYSFYVEGETMEWLHFFLDEFLESIKIGYRKVAVYKEFKRNFSDHLRENLNLRTTEELAERLISSPVISYKNISSNIRDTLHNKEIFHQLLEQGIINEIHESDNEPLFSCPVTLDFWEREERRSLLIE